MPGDPGEACGDIAQLSEEIGLRRGAVVERKHCETVLCERYVEIAVEFLIPVYESAAVDIDVDRQRAALADNGVMG